MKLTDFEFDLPLESIAQYPSKIRDHSRLMILNRKDQTIEHDFFFNIEKYIKEFDTVVFNDTKVFPARLFGNKSTGGQVELLILNPVGDGWEFLGRNVTKDGEVVFPHGLTGKVAGHVVTFNMDRQALFEYLEKYGQVPLPPYIKTDKSKERYQTVYAKIPGSAAAPTAGFHFSEKLIKRLSDEGKKMEYVTLHVGLGTFAPIKSLEIEDHQIHKEWYTISEETRSKIQDLRSKILAVGTTSVRTLETWANTGESEGETDIYIYPGFEFKIVKGMVTNFHMPKSSLVLLVSAFAGREFILKAYKLGIEMGYRWGSFGDAMLIV